MQTRSFLAASLLAAFIGSASAVGAADSRDTTKDSTMTPPSQRATPDRDHQSGGMQGGGMMGGMGDMMGGDGMMGRGMMDGMGGMMGIMNGCSQMMGSGATPHLPPGNEKLQLKMQAEIMQKTAEILSRYADQIGEPK